MVRGLQVHVVESAVVEVRFTRHSPARERLTLACKVVLL